MLVACGTFLPGDAVSVLPRGFFAVPCPRRLVSANNVCLGLYLSPPRHGRRTPYGLVSHPHRTPHHVTPADTHGRALRRHLRHPLLLLPRRTTHPLRLAWVRAMHRTSSLSPPLPYPSLTQPPRADRLDRDSAQRPLGAVRRPNRRVPAPVRLRWVPRVRQRAHRREPDDHFLGCAQVSVLSVSSKHLGSGIE